MTVVSDYRALLSNTSWTGMTGAGIILTYSFPTTPSATVAAGSVAAANSFHAATESEKAVVRTALAAWSAVSGVVFKEVSATPGDLTFGFYDLALISGMSGEAGLGNFPSTGSYVDSSGAPQVYSNFLPQGGDVYFDNSYQTNSSFFSDFLHIAIHEIGHALGLKHPFDPAGAGASYTLDPSLDNGTQTIMAYAGVRGAALGPLDIQAIQSIYGTAAGATHPFTQVWNAATESVTTTGNGNRALTLFGSGGSDTIYSLGMRDALSGGEGNDVFYLAGRPAGVNGGSGTDTAVTGLAYSAGTLPVQGSGAAVRYVYLPAYADFQTFVNVATLDFTNGSYATATSSFTPYANTLSWNTGTGWVLAGTSGGTASTLPTTTALDQVALTGSTSAGAPAVIGSSGVAGSLNLNSGYASLTGTYGVSALNVGSLGVADLAVGATGRLRVAGEAVVRQASTSTAALVVGSGAIVQAAGLALTGGGALQVAQGTGTTSVQVAAGGTLEIGSGGTPGTGVVTIDANGTVSGTGSIGPAVVNNGTIRASGGTLYAAGVTGSGTVAVAADGTLILGGGLMQGVSFLGSGGVLELLNPGAAATVGSIGNFAPGNTVEVQSTAGAATAANYNPGTGLLALTNGSGTVASLRLAGSYGASLFSVTAKPGGITDVSVTAADPLFDAAYYLAANPDVAAAGVNPYQHYLSFGWREGRNPDALFDTRYYLTQNPDVAAAGVNPLLHFEASGWREGRQPSLLFDDARYLAANPDVAAAGVDPLAHYLVGGQAEGRLSFLTGGTAAADPLVDAAYYDHQLGATLLPGGAAGAQQAAWSYDASGWQKGLNPDAFFDTKYYLAHYPDVAAAHVDPLLHYETYGWKEGRDPSAQFSTNKYLAAYGDVRNAGMDPLVHYVMYGQNEGRTAFSV